MTKRCSLNFLRSDCARSNKSAPSEKKNNLDEVGQNSKRTLLTEIEIKKHKILLHGLK